MRIQKNLRERACAKKAWGGGWTIGKPYACRRDCGTLPRRRRPATPAQSTWLFGYIMMECGAAVTDAIGRCTYQRKHPLQAAVRHRRVRRPPPVIHTIQFAVTCRGPWATCCGGRQSVLFLRRKATHSFFAFPVCLVMYIQTRGQDACLKRGPKTDNQS